MGVGLKPVVLRVKVRRWLNSIKGLRWLLLHRADNLEKDAAKRRPCNVPTCSRRNSASSGCSPTGILSFHKTGQTSGKMEGTNRKIRGLLASACGFSACDFLKLRLYALHEAVPCADAKFKTGQLK